MYVFVCVNVLHTSEMGRVYVDSTVVGLKPFFSASIRIFLSLFYLARFSVLAKIFFFSLPLFMNMYKYDMVWYTFFTLLEFCQQAQQTNVFVYAALLSHSISARVKLSMQKHDAE